MPERPCEEALKHNLPLDSLMLDLAQAMRHCQQRVGDVFNRSSMSIG